EPSTCNLHLHPPCDARLYSHQHCVLLLHVPSRAAGVERCGCDIWREAARNVLLGDAHLCSSFHLWGDQRILVYIF
ncbi:hypothetical protein M9458_015955, partial [Cirrhinus mrigala]